MISEGIFDLSIEPEYEVEQISLERATELARRREFDGEFPIYKMSARQILGYVIHELAKNWNEDHIAGIHVLNDEQEWELVSLRDDRAEGNLNLYFKLVREGDDVAVLFRDNGQGFHPQQYFDRAGLMMRMEKTDKTMGVGLATYNLGVAISQKMSRDGELVSVGDMVYRSASEVEISGREVAIKDSRYPGTEFSFTTRLTRDEETGIENFMPNDEYAQAGDILAGFDDFIPAQKVAEDEPGYMGETFIMPSDEVEVAEDGTVTVVLAGDPLNNKGDEYARMMLALRLSPHVIKNNSTQTARKKVYTSDRADLQGMIFKELITETERIEVLFTGPRNPNYLEAAKKLEEAGLALLESKVRYRYENESEEAVRDYDNGKIIAQKLGTPLRTYLSRQSPAGEIGSEQFNEGSRLLAEWFRGALAAGVLVPDLELDDFVVETSPNGSARLLGIDLETADFVPEGREQIIQWLRSRKRNEDGRAAVSLFEYFIFRLVYSDVESDDKKVIDELSQVKEQFYPEFSREDWRLVSRVFVSAYNHVKRVQSNLTKEAAKAKKSAWNSKREQADDFRDRMIRATDQLLRSNKEVRSVFSKVFLKTVDLLENKGETGERNEARDALADGISDFSEAVDQTPVLGLYLSGDEGASALNQLASGRLEAQDAIKSVTMTAASKQESVSVSVDAWVGDVRQQIASLDNTTAGIYEGLFDPSFTQGVESSFAEHFSAIPGSNRLRTELSSDLVSHVQVAALSALDPAIANVDSLMTGAANIITENAREMLTNANIEDYEAIFERMAASGSIGEAQRTDLMRQELSSVLISGEYLQNADPRLTAVNFQQNFISQGINPAVAYQIGTKQESFVNDLVKLLPQLGKVAFRHGEQISQKKLGFEYQRDLGVVLNQGEQFRLSPGSDAGNIRGFYARSSYLTEQDLNPQEWVKIAWLVLNAELLYERLEEDPASGFRSMSPENFISIIRFINDMAQEYEAMKAVKSSA